MRFLPTALVCLLVLCPTSVLAERGSPDLNHARPASSMDRRDREIIVGFARGFVDWPARCEPDPWPLKVGKDPLASANLQIARLAAAAYMLANEDDFSDWQGVMDDVKTWCGPLDSDYRGKLIAYLNKIFVPYPKYLFVGYQTIGTGGDYNMVLMGLVNMLYMLTYEKGILGEPNAPLPPELWEAAYGVLCHDGGLDFPDGSGCEFQDPGGLNPNWPFPRRRELQWDGMNAYMAFRLEENYFTSKLRLGSVFGSVTRPETENHVLSIHMYNYLVSMWILRMGLDYSTGMAVDHKIRQWAIEGLTWLQQPGNMEEFFSPILMALGRVVHNGFFETNARPYQELSVFAILTLAVYGDIFEDMPLSEMHAVPDEVRDYARRVRQAARNAMHYSAATFAFQSLRGKRSSPMRRRHTNRDTPDFYGGNRAAFLFGLLSGAHEYDDCTDATNASCDLFKYSKLDHRHKILWAALMRLTARKSNNLRGYELPRAIHGQFFDPRPYFGIMQARASLGQYPRTGIPPRYFDPQDPTRTQLPGEWRGSPELYFGTGDLMLTAGGMYCPYYQPEYLPWAELDPQYRFFSRATMLFPRGDFGHPYDDNDPRPTQWKSLADGSGKDVLVMRGRRDEWWKSDCNVWTYKSFAYGYSYDRTVEKPWSRGWVQAYPDWWDDHPKRSFDIEETAFRLFYFAPGVLGYDVNNHIDVGGDSDGYYVVMARLRKDGAGNIFKWWHWNYRRGILEVVPGSLYPSLDALEAELKAWHDPSFRYFSAGDHDDDRPYKYVTMTSHERLTLDPKMGADPKIGVLNETYTYPKYYRSYCRDGIRSVETLVDPGSGPAGSDLDYRWMEIDREELYIPKKIRQNSQRKNIPLARVWELDERYERTGRMLMEELDRGRLAIRRVDWHQVGIGGSGPIMIPIWDCLIVDSHDHTQPKEDERVVLDYEECGSPGFSPHRVASAAVGLASTCVATFTGEVWCWGKNDTGQLGTGDLASSSSPRKVLVLPGSRGVAVGNNHACALLLDGRVGCWGDNSHGQLGDGTTVSRSLAAAPVLFPGDEPIRASTVASGRYHGCALGRDGEVFCWGANSFGQVGRDGLGAYYPYAHEVDLPERAVAVTVGGYHSCALFGDGTVWCWGLNHHGQLGDGTRDDGPEPRQVQFPPRVWEFSAIEISAGGFHTCALGRIEYNIRRVYCWGDNSANQLGVSLVGEAQSTSVPARLTAFGPLDNASADVVRLAAGAYHTCAVDEDDETWCWGDNTHGQLGDPGAPDKSALAVKVLGLLPERRYLSQGLGQHICTVDEAREIQCWGSHSDGQLGSGAAADSLPHYMPQAVAWP